MSEHPTIVFDGVCNLCEWSVVFVIRRDAAGRFRFASAQSAAGARLQRRHGISAIEAGTVILIKDGRVYTKSDAALEIAKDLDGPWRALAVLAVVPRPLRNWVYSFIGDRRYAWFGKKAQCLVPTRELADRFL
jgi:predicted DCC family thiol-disulfide oxidoreductase YuxK